MFAEAPVDEPLFVGSACPARPSQRSSLLPVACGFTRVSPLQSFITSSQRWGTCRWGGSMVFSEATGHTYFQVKSDTSEERVLLESRISRNDIYQRQQDTLIVWQEPESGRDIALSFQEAAPRILQSIGDCLGWPVGGCWTVDTRAGVLRCVGQGPAQRQRVGVGLAGGVVLQVVELTNLGVAAVKQFQVKLGRDRAQLHRTDAQGHLVHALAP